MLKQNLKAKSLNRNIGCIETSKSRDIKHIRVNLNRNIGCIETSTTSKPYPFEYNLNRNIGCIETSKENFKKAAEYT